MEAGEIYVQDSALGIRYYTIGTAKGVVEVCIFDTGELAGVARLAAAEFLPEGPAPLRYGDPVPVEAASGAAA